MAADEQLSERDLVRLYHRARGVAVEVEGVAVVGNARTKPSLILAELWPGLGGEHTLDGLYAALEGAAGRLRDTGLFSAVEVSAAAPASGAPGRADVTVTVVEKPVLSLHGGTFVQARQGGGGLLLLLRLFLSSLSPSPLSAPAAPLRNAFRATRAAWRRARG